LFARHEHRQVGLLYAPNNIFCLHFFCPYANYIINTSAAY
jgi:hypothetical protein